MLIRTGPLNKSEIILTINVLKQSKASLDQRPSRKIVHCSLCRVATLLIHKSRDLKSPQ